jgi:predicted dehydrogenase
MSASRPTAAVVGVGRMGLRHLKALRRIGVEVIAIADPRPDNLEAARAEAPDAAAYTEWGGLIRSHRPDLITVATTSPSHASIVIGAAEAGIERVLCEKPIATSLHAAHAMVDACCSRGTRLVVNHPRRRLQVYLTIQDALDRDRFGDLRFIRATCGTAGLANVGSHAFDLMRWFLGPPECAIGSLERNPAPNPRGSEFCDPGGHGMFWFADERRGTFDFCGDFSTSLIVEFGCRYGSITVDERTCTVRAAARSLSARSEPLHMYQTPTQPVELEFGDPVDIVKLTAAMVEDALSDEPTACSGRDAINALEMVAAVHLSHRAKAPIQFPVMDDDGALARIP